MKGSQNAGRTKGKHMKQRKKTIIMLYCLLLAAFSVYFLLDTFVIERVYSTELSSGEVREQDTAVADSASENGGSRDDQVLNTTETVLDQQGSGVLQESSVYEKAADPVITENSYSDENISIEITEYRENDTDIYVAEITVSSADYLKTALAKGLYGRNVTAKTSETAASNGAILAINGDYYGSQQNGYVIRGGVLYRSSAVRGREDLVIYSDGSFGIINETEISAEQLLADGAKEVLSFGPALLENGKISVSVTDEVARAMASNPRTAIGIIDELHFVFVVSDGRTSRSAGLSVYELAEFMKSLGVQTAYNLDGGGSSTMYFNGEVINDPVGGGRGQSERSVSDIVYIGY